MFANILECRIQTKILKQGFVSFDIKPPLLFVL